MKEDAYTAEMRRCSGQIIKKHENQYNWILEANLYFGMLFSPIMWLLTSSRSYFLCEN